MAGKGAEEDLRKIPQHITAYKGQGSARKGTETEDLKKSRRKECT